MFQNMDSCKQFFWLARRKRVPAEKNARDKKPFQRADGGTVARRRNTKG